MPREHQRYFITEQNTELSICDWQAWQVSPPTPAGERGATEATSPSPVKPTQISQSEQKARLTPGTREPSRHLAWPGQRRTDQSREELHAAHDVPGVSARVSARVPRGPPCDPVPTLPH